MANFGTYNTNTTEHHHHKMTHCTSQHEELRNADDQNNICGRLRNADPMQSAKDREDVLYPHLPTTRK